jgi:hypothetical protein
MDLIARTCGEGWLPMVEEIFQRVPESVCISNVYQNGERYNSMRSNGVIKSKHFMKKSKRRA